MMLVDKERNYIAVAVVMALLSLQVREKLLGGMVDRRL
jgi:hypothetical protein